MTREPAADPADPRLVSGRAWEELCDALRRAGRLVLGEGVPDSPRARAEGFRYLARFLASGVANCITHDDADYPLFGRMIEYARPWGLDNPDCLYLYAPLRGGAQYRVWGRRGSARHVEFQVNFGHFASGDIAQWGTISALDGFALECARDGHFELRIGGEPRAANWLASRADAQFLLVRQLFADWEREAPADLAIEREGAAWPIPPPRTDWVADHLEKLAGWLEKGGALWERMSRAYLSLPPNSLVVHRPEAAGARAGAGGQAYGMGNFHCEPGQAVIVEFEPPPCHYWGLSLANWWWECIEYASRQSSLNDAQAALDSDGRLRAVIAHADPGVPNWLDPAGNERGSLTARFVRADLTPEVRLRAVPAAELRSFLPADTPQVAPAERAAALARRRHAVLRRHRR
jgi:hypothetical protein